MLRHTGDSPLLHQQHQSQAFRRQSVANPNANASPGDLLHGRQNDGRDIYDEYVRRDSLLTAHFKAVPLDERPRRRSSWLDRGKTTVSSSWRLCRDCSLMARTSPIIPSFQPEQLPKKVRRIQGICVLGTCAFVAAGILYLAVRAVVNLRPAPKATYRCPTPFASRRSALANRASISQPIVLPIASHAPLHPFRITVKYALNACNVFTLTLARKDQGVCRRAPDLVRASFDADQDRWIKERLGPDTIHIQVDGAERRAVDRPTRFDATACTYDFDFELNNAGPVWLNVTLLYEDYEGYKEVVAPEQSRPKPNLIMLPLNDRPIELNVCSNVCTMHRAPPAGLSAPPPPIPPREAYPGARGLTAAPLCPSGDRTPRNGSFIPKSMIANLYPSHDLTVSTRLHRRLVAGHYSYLHSGCQPSHDGLLYRNHASCVRNPHRALITGDSHGRAVFDVAVHRLNGSVELLDHSPKALSKQDQIGGLNMVRGRRSARHETQADDEVPQEFTWDPYLDVKPTCGRFGDFDSITVSFGTHTASHNCPNTTLFISHVTSILESWPAALASCKANKT